MLKRKKILLEETELELGRFDPEAEGMYRNIEAYRFEVRSRKGFYARIEASSPIDVGIIGTDGYNLKFQQGVTDVCIGPLSIKEKGEMALVLGTYPGDRSNVRVSAWME